MKRIYQILSLMLIAVMIFICPACSADGNSGDAEGPVSLSIATGGTSGTYYGYCGIIAQVFNQELGDTMNLSAVSTGASMANIQQMQVGASQIAIVQNDVMDYAYNATDLFEGQDPYTDFSTSWYAIRNYPDYRTEGHYFDRPVKNSRVSTGDAGSGQVNASDPSRLPVWTSMPISLRTVSPSRTPLTLKNGQIVPAFVVLQAPTAAVTDLLRKRLPSSICSK